MKISRCNSTTVRHLLIISVVGFLIYSNTLMSAFQFDDKLNIVDNLFIRDIGNLWPPSGARWFGLLTFSLNYMAGGANPFGYHLANTAIHLLTAWSLYLFILLTFNTPYFSDCKDTAISENRIALACALLFVAHPLQTQAVTYIVQRFASLAALLFMLALDSYILARVLSGNSNIASLPCKSRPDRVRWPLYAAAGLFFALSLKTKENAYTLPAVAVVYDVMFICSISGLRATIRKKWQVLVSCLLLIAAVLFFIFNKIGLLAISETLKATNEISRHDYLITQFRVIVTYIRLLFIPVNQTIDHHYKVSSNILAPEIIASLAVITLLTAVAVYLFKASYKGSTYLRLVSFGIFFFFITLSIESSFIPIIDVMFEHRLYLPSIGAILAVTAICAFALERLPLNPVQRRRTAAGLLAVTVLTLSCAAYLRNMVWKSELTLWSDVIAKTPRNPRGYNMLGSYYQANFRINDAIYYYSKALEVDSSYAEARSNLGNAYIQTGRIDEGLNELMVTAQSHRFDAIDTGILYYNIGKGYLKKKMPDQALESLNNALRYIPDEPAVYALLGEVFLQKNLLKQSAAHFKKAHELDPLKY